MKMKVILLVVSLVSLLTNNVSAAVLKQIHVVTRHGSRYPLVKNAGNLSESSPGTLTPLGQEQHYRLGQWLRQYYNDLADFLVPSRVRFESSSFDRTIRSASSFSLGLFNVSNIESPIIPIYGLDLSNDITIRAYDKCNTFHVRLDQLYESNEWKAVEANYSDLLDFLSNVSYLAQYRDESTGKIPLTEVWNVFDIVMVARLECGNNSTAPSCTTLGDARYAETLLTANQWEELQEMAGQGETMRYGSKTAGQLLGGNILLQMVERMKNATATDEGFYYHYSAHYPTLLGIFSALGDEPVNKAVIPGYAAAMIFELYLDTDTDEKSVHILYKRGDNIDEQVVPLGTSCSNESICTLDRLVEFMGNKSQKQWCQECGNLEANVCLKAALTAAQQEADTCSSGRLANPALAGALSGLGLCILVALLAYLFVKRRSIKEGVVTDEPKDNGGIA